MFILNIKLLRLDIKKFQKKSLVINDLNHQYNICKILSGETHIIKLIATFFKIKINSGVIKQIIPTNKWYLRNFLKENMNLIFQ